MNTKSTMDVSVKQIIDRDNRTETYSVSVQESSQIYPIESSAVVVGTATSLLTSAARPTIVQSNQDYIHQVTTGLSKPSKDDEDSAIGEEPPGTPLGNTPDEQTHKKPADTSNTSLGVTSTMTGRSKRPHRHRRSSDSSEGGTTAKSRDSNRSYADTDPRISSSTSNAAHFSAEAQGPPQQYPLTTAKHLQVSSDSTAHQPQLVVGSRHSSSSSPRNLQISNVNSPQAPSPITHTQPFSHQQSSGPPSLQRPQSGHSSHSSPRVSSSSPLPPALQYSERDPDYQAVKTAAECLHAHDYTKMANILAPAPSTIPVLFGKGLAYYKLAKYTQAVKAFEEMLRQSVNNEGMKGSMYLAHYYIGEIDLGHSRYEQAAHHFAQSADAFCTHTIAKRYRIIPPSLAILHSKRGSALNHSHKVMDAVKAYEKAISLSVTPKDKLAACTSLGNLYQSLGDNQNAMKQYEETIELAGQLQDFVYLGWAHGNMGNAYLGLFQKEKALQHLEKSLELTVKHEPSPQAIGRAYNNLGTAHQSLGEMTKAEEYYDLALSQAIYGRDQGGQARAYGNIGNLLMIQKKYESAIMHYTEAMAISKDRSTKSTAYHNRGCASYEKAEADKKKFFERLHRSSPSTQPELPLVTYKGPNVHHLPQAPSHLPSSMQDLYEQGRSDLMKVVESHEETIQTIKGSTQGLTLSVSLSETNSRTFHRLQDCLFNLDDWERALEYAEQSRARSLGELLLERKGRSLPYPLVSPLAMEQITHIIDKVNTTIVYISYTGSRLLVWVYTPVHGYMTTNMFQVSLSDDQFDGKSLDYYLRYSLSEILIESNMEMYSVTGYDEQSPLTVLFELIGKPLLDILDAVHTQTNAAATKDVILIPDSYTNLMPMVALLNQESGKFLGDRYRFRYMPSLLTLGILCQQPQAVVEVLEESRSFCVVGNPTIPPFKYQGDTMNLGKLPHATKEAEWVAHILKCNPTLHDQATKMLVLSMMNTAKVVHLATHGSAVSGFLAFAGRGSSRSKEVSEDKMVLLYPEEVEKLSISPALVVLSSCDSGRGVVKADGIQGMARAFILAGAQSVLTSLWRVPDESASAFMQFFYQYLMDGFQSSLALQKAILSVRAFSKYSRYIHWSGYQLTGREVRLVAKRTIVDQEVRGRVGVTAVFPRLSVIKKLEGVFIKEPRVPTDVQLLHGVHGLKPSEPVIDFITKYHTHFSGGVFWVNGSSPELIRAAELQIQKALDTVPASLMEPTLVVLDNFTSLPEPGHLLTLLRSNNTHIITLTHTLSLPDNYRKEIDHQLIRGLNVVPLKPLSRLHSTQRIVHSVLCEHKFTPHTREQNILADIADRVGGSPTVVDTTSALLTRCVQECEGDKDFLDEFTKRVLEDLPKKASTQESNEQSITRFTSSLIHGFRFSESEYLLLKALAMFGPVPVPKSVVDKAQSYVMLAKPSSESQSSLMPVSNLISAKLLKVYPSPVIAPPRNSITRTASYTSRRGSTDSTQIEEEAEYFYVPQLIKDALWDSMRPFDQEIAITIAYKCVEHMEGSKNVEDLNRLYGGGLVRMLIELLESKGKEVHNRTLLDLNCYQELIKLYVTLRVGDHI